MPYINILESSLNRSILLEKEKEKYFFKVNTDSVLQTTQAERYEALNTGISSGILSLNEARIKENLPPIEDDFHRLSLGAVMYQPSDRTFFIPNMGTVYDAENKQIISSPDIVKQGITGQQDQNQNLNNEEEEDDNNE